MISTQFILRMLNGPLVQFINFIVYAQYAKVYFRMIQSQGNRHGPENVERREDTVEKTRCR